MLLGQLGHDVVRIKAFVVENKRQFPYLSGPKLLNYWLYMLTVFTDVRLHSRHEISIIPDVHVRRASYRLGIVDADISEDPDKVAAAWKHLLDGSDIAPCDLHAPLWRWSRAGFPDIA